MCLLSFTGWFRAAFVSALLFSASDLCGLFAAGDARRDVPAAQATLMLPGQEARSYAPAGIGGVGLCLCLTPPPSFSFRRLCDLTGPDGPLQCFGEGRRRRVAPSARHSRRSPTSGAISSHRDS
ncbi:hypothetical protein NDU88_005755 [Pleurodeles waltl]|uniref:Secreted protein n=1 Tax=Pleurodeles waltl TaxID=8319 RepID=A0AAV7VM45_PLEWA|nr:hypothetical protein NDU88_005755 [Pleurodeles waltl]